MAGLFRESWEIFQRRFSTLIGLVLLGAVACAAPMAAAAALGMFAGAALGKTAMAAVGVAGCVASLYLGLRCFAGFLCAVADERLSVREALAGGKALVAGVAWVGFLVGFVVTGGFMLFVIPGIVFAVWFFFAHFVLVREECRGMDALLKSREYVRGEWFNVALRLLLVWAASLLVGAIPFAGPILGIVFIPFVTIYHYLVYRDLREMKGEVPFPCSFADRAKWPGVALLGMVAVPVALISVIGLSFLGPITQFASRGGIAIEQGSPGPKDLPGDQEYRVITFPEGVPPAADITVGQPSGYPSPVAAESESPPPTAGQFESPPPAAEEPDDLHVFIYAVNYTGTIRVNGAPLRVLEGKTDMQYNYNTDGRAFRYGTNQVEVDYAELPSHQEGLLKVKMKVSRSRDGAGRENLGEWEFEDKGSGTKSFTIDIPR